MGLIARRFFRRISADRFLAIVLITSSRMATASWLCRVMYDDIAASIFRNSFFMGFSIQTASHESNEAMVFESLFAGGLDGGRSCGSDVRRDGHGFETSGTLKQCVGNDKCDY